MIVTVLTLIFVFIVLILGLAAKRVLYANEHEASIQNELNTFENNFKNIESINIEADYKIGSDHIYK